MLKVKINKAPQAAAALNLFFVYRLTNPAGHRKFNTLKLIQSA